MLAEEEKKKQAKLDREKAIQEAKLKKTRAEREADPHFQFLKIQTNTDDSAAEFREKEKERLAAKAKVRAREFRSHLRLHP